MNMMNMMIIMIINDTFIFRFAYTFQCYYCLKLRYIVMITQKSRFSTDR